MIGTENGKLPYGVAHNIYGRGMVVTNKFASLADANLFAADFKPGGAMVCTFENGKWKPVWP